ncbi:MAG: pyridoxamine 5'-phosphate oxidase family protein [Actinomycetota bacterium]|nr:pyridoxamine 5'-phosphate oxidase family protein [Actinomycetota bacterium]
MSDAIEAFLAEPRNAIVAGARRDGRLHLTPNWFLWDGERFFISTTRDRAKYRIFTDNPRVQLMIDDSLGFRYLIVDGTNEWGEDVDEGLPYFRDLRHKHGRHEADDEQLRAEMIRGERVLMMITPDKPLAAWPNHGF